MDEFGLHTIKCLKSCGFGMQKCMHHCKWMSGTMTRINLALPFTLSHILIIGVHWSLQVSIRAGEQDLNEGNYNLIGALNIQDRSMESHCRLCMLITLSLVIFTIFHLFCTAIQPWCLSIYGNFPHCIASVWQNASFGSSTCDRTMLNVSRLLNPLPILQQQERSFLTLLSY